MHIVLWKWNQPGFREAYTHHHVNMVGDMIQRNLNGAKARIVCVTDDPSQINMSIDVHQLWKDHQDTPNISGRHLPSCYRRLRLFDPVMQKEMGISPGERIMSLDLDTIIAGDLRPVLKREERFVGWAVRGTQHMRVFNGSIFMFNAGDMEEIWKDFDPKTSPKLAFGHGFFGSDQGWMSYKLAQRNDCAGVGYPQVASYPRELTRRPILPKETIIINFHGRKKPWHPDVQQEAPWVAKLWRMNDAIQQQQRIA